MSTIRYKCECGRSVFIRTAEPTANAQIVAEPTTVEEFKQLFQKNTTEFL